MLKSHTMKNYILICVITLFFLHTNNTKAQNCSQGLTMINDLWQNFDPLDLINDKQAVNSQVNKLKSEVASFAKMSLKKDAPRLLPVGSSEKKINLKHNRKRIFVTTPIKQENIVITITRPETETEVTVVICYHTLKGESANLEQITFGKSEEKEISIPLENVQGKILSVNIKNESLKKIAYRISAR